MMTPYFTLYNLGNARLRPENKYLYINLPCKETVSKI